MGKATEYIRFNKKIKKCSPHMQAQKKEHNKQKCKQKPKIEKRANFPSRIQIKLLGVIGFQRAR